MQQGDTTTVDVKPATGPDGLIGIASDVAEGIGSCEHIAVTVVGEEVGVPQGIDFQCHEVVVVVSPECDGPNRIDLGHHVAAFVVNKRVGVPEGVNDPLGGIVGIVEQLNRVASGIHQVHEPALNVIFRAHSRAAQRINNLLQVMQPVRAVNELRDIGFTIRHGDQVATRIVHVADDFPHWIGDGGNASLRIATDVHALAGRMDYSRIGESERVSVDINHLRHLSRFCIDLVGKTFFGGERINAPQRGVVWVVNRGTAIAVNGIPISIGILLKHDIQTIGHGE